MVSNLINNCGYLRNKKSQLRDGLGIQLWADGSKYEGMWREGRCTGKGRMTHANGDIYQG